MSAETKAKKEATNKWLEIRKETRQLFSAIENSDIRAIDALLKNGSSLHDENEEGWTPLAWACKKYKTKSVAFLLKTGADINQQDSICASTALMQAAERGYNGIIKMLLDHNANIDLRDFSGNTALNIAASEGDISTMRILIEHGANKENRDNYGMTPFLNAANKDHHEAVKFLAEMGADINAVSHEGNPVEHFLARSAYPHRSAALMDYLKVLREDKVLNQSITNANEQQEGVAF